MDVLAHAIVRDNVLERHVRKSVAQPGDVNIANAPRFYRPMGVDENSHIADVTAARPV